MHRPIADQDHQVRLTNIQAGCHVANLPVHPLIIISRSGVVHVLLRSIASVWLCLHICVTEMIGASSVMEYCRVCPWIYTPVPPPPPRRPVRSLCLPNPDVRGQTTHLGTERTGKTPRVNCTSSSRSHLQRRKLFSILLVAQQNWRALRADQKPPFLSLR